VVEVAKSIKPSNREELEITDINNWYLNKSELEVAKVKGEWLDAGTYDSLLEAQKIAKEKLADNMII
jgi:glucose-1-phosphate thymidylyltransferase